MSRNINTLVPGTFTPGGRVFSSCKGDASAGSVGKTIVLCGWAFYEQRYRNQPDEVAKSIFHEWLHVSGDVPGRTGTADDAEKITGNSYFRAVMKGACGTP